MGITKWSEFSAEIAVYKTFEELKVQGSKIKAMAKFLSLNKAASDLQDKCGIMLVENEAQIGGWLNENYPSKVKACDRKSSSVSDTDDEKDDQLPEKMPVKSHESINARLLFDNEELRKQAISAIIKENEKAEKPSMKKNISVYTVSRVIRNMKAQAVKDSLQPVELPTVKKYRIKNFTKIPNELMGLKLNSRDKLMLAYLMSHKEGFKINKSFIAKALNITRKTVLASLNRLTEAGMITIKNDTLTITNEVEKTGEITEKKVDFLLTNNTIKQDEKQDQKNKTTKQDQSLGEYFPGYTSYFNLSNYPLVIDLFRRFKMEYPNSKITLTKFDRLVFYMYWLFISTDENIDIETMDIDTYFKMDIDTYFNQNPNINVHVVQIIIKAVNEDERIRNEFLMVVEKYKEFATTVIP
jgi:predicted transcriptional regulator